MNGSTKWAFKLVRFNILNRKLIIIIYFLHRLFSYF